MLTFITTVIGFLSIYLNKVVVLKEFALVSSFGLLANFIVTIILVPNLLYLFEKERKNQLEYKKFVDFVRKILLFVDGKKIVFVVALFAVVFALFIPNLKVDNNMLNYFKNSSVVKKRAEIFKKYTHGINTFYIIVKAPKNRAFKKYKYVQALWKIEEFIKNNTKFNYALSVADNLAWLNKQMHYGSDKYFKVPHSNMAIAQYYMLFYRADLRKYVDEKYRVAKIDVWHNISSSSEFNKELQKLKEYIKSLNLDAKVYFTGKNVLINKAADTISQGQLVSILVTIIMVFIVISIAFKTIKAGFVIFLGNIVPIIMLFGVMSVVNIPLNIVTAIIATITFGIVVDDTIHLMMKYRYEHKRLKNRKRVTLIVVKKEASPIILTSLSLSLGFLSLATSDFVPVIQFAFLSIFVILVALLIDLIFVPVLLKNIDISKD
jgi:predicted RND superfamily exporter protein